MLTEEKQQEEDVIVSFNKAMGNKISERHNRYRPMGWSTMDLKRLLKLLKGEIEELEEAIKEKDTEHIKDESIDVANYCMFIWHKQNEK